MEGMIWTAGIRRGNVLTAKMHGMSTSALTVINVIPNFSAVSTFSQSRGVPCAGCDMASCPCPSARCPRKCWDHCANVLVPPDRIPPKQRGPNEWPAVQVICSAPLLKHAHKRKAYLKKGALMTIQTTRPFFERGCGWCPPHTEDEERALDQAEADEVLERIEASVYRGD